MSKTHRTHLPKVDYAERGAERRKARMRELTQGKTSKAARRAARVSLRDMER
jgi:hypothetical protein